MINDIWTGYIQCRSCAFSIRNFCHAFLFLFRFPLRYSDFIYYSDGFLCEIFCWKTVWLILVVQREILMGVIVWRFGLVCLSWCCRSNLDCCIRFWGGSFFFFIVCEFFRLMFWYCSVYCRVSVFSWWFCDSERLNMFSQRDRLMFVLLIQMSEKIDKRICFVRQFGWPFDFFLCPVWKTPRGRFVCYVVIWRYVVITGYDDRFRREKKLCQKVSSFLFFVRIKR